MHEGENRMMSNRYCQWIIGALVSTVSVACFVSTLKIDPKDVSSFKEGVTTKKDIRARYGNPTIGGSGPLQGSDGRLRDCDN